MGTRIANFIKAGLSVTVIRGLHTVTYGLSQQRSYSVLHWLCVRSRTLCPYHSQLLDAATTRHRLYSSVTVPHDSQNNHQISSHDLPTSIDDQFVPERTIGLTKAEQKKLLRKRPEHLDKSRILKVAIIGAPNAGKSTLANMLMGWRFASVSKKVHTTRHRAIGVLTEGDTQIVFLDTPGMITPRKRQRHRLEMSLLTDPHSVLYEADLIAVIVDVANVWHRARIEEEVLKALHLHRTKPAILVLNKIDQLKRKEELLSITRILTEGIVGGQQNWSTVKPTKKRINVEKLFEKMDSEKININLQGTRNDSKSSSSKCISDTDNRLDPTNKGHVSHDQENIMDRMMTSRSCEMAESSLAELEMENELEKTDKESSEMTKMQSFVGEIAVEDGTMIEVHGSSQEELDIFLVGEKNNLHDDNDENPDSANVKEQWSETATRGQQRPDLRDGEVWRMYYRRVQEAKREVDEKRGWDNFDAVFMLSALEGDGVVDLKNYLLESAAGGPWQFHSSLVTDQDPIEIARMCVWEKMLDHLPEEIPYQIKIRLALWEIDEDNMLRATFELLCETKRHMFAALGKGGQTAKLIAIEAKQDLMNTFRRDLSLKLVVRCKQNAK